MLNQTFYMEPTKLFPDMVTHAISTYNNLDYLKLALKSIKKNAHYKKVIVYAENCTDGTDEWLRQNYGGDVWPNGETHEPNVRFYIEKNEVPQGIGGGMNKCAELVKTEYINFIHSDFWVTKDFDLPLFEIVSKAPKTLASSWRIEPDIFGGNDRLGTTIAPKEEFGHLHSNFDSTHFDEWAEEFKKNNLIRFRKAEGVSFMIRKTDWDFIGGNDPLFAPASMDDYDIFLRMSCMDFDFVETSESVVFHFGARGSIFRGDDLTTRHPRQVKAERDNQVKWLQKWKEPLRCDEQGFIIKTPTLLKRFHEIYSKF